METARLSTNIKQNCAEQCICQQKEFGHSGGRLFWSLSDCILLYLFILHFEKAWMKMLQMPKSLQSHPSFPHGCGIFSTGNILKLAFSKKFNSDVLASWEGFKKQFPFLWHKPYRAIFEMGLASIWEPCICNKVQSITKSSCHELLLHRVGTTRNTRGVRAPRKTSTGSPISDPLCPSTKPRWVSSSFPSW